MICKLKQKGLLLSLAKACSLPDSHDSVRSRLHQGHRVMTTAADSESHSSLLGTGKTLKARQIATKRKGNEVESNEYFILTFLSSTKLHTILKINLTVSKV